MSKHVASIPESINKFRAKIKGLLEVCFSAVFEASVRFPALTIALFLTLFLACGLGMRHLKFELNVYDLTDDSLSSKTQLLEMKKNFADEKTLLLVVKANNGPLVKKDICDWNQWITNIERSFPGITKIQAPWKMVRPVQNEGRLNYKYFKPLNCQNLEEPYPLEWLQQTPLTGYLIDKNSQDLAIEINFDQQFIPQDVEILLSKFKTDFLKAHSNLDFYAMGDAAFQWHFKKMLYRDAMINPLIFLIFFLFFRFFYGRWRGGTFYITTIIGMGVIIYGFMGFAGAPIDVLSNNIFLITAIAGAEDFLVISQALKQGGKTLQQIFKDLMLPCFFTSFTTAIGFGSLMLSELSVIRRFGLWCAVGSMVEFVLVFLFLPSICLLLGSKGQWVDFTRLKQPAWMASLENLKLNLKWPSIALFVFAMFFCWKLNVNDSPRDTFPQGHMHSRSFHYFRESRGWEGYLYVTFPKSADDQTVEQTNEKIREQRNIAKVLGPKDLLKWTIKNQNSTIQKIVQNEFPISATQQKFITLNLEQRSVVFLNSVDYADLQQTVGIIRELCRDVLCAPVGEAVVFTEYSEKVSATLIESFALSLCLVFIILLLLAWLNEIPNLRALVYSSIWAPIVMLGLMGYFKVPINLITCLFPSILVGLAGDNAIQFIYAAKKGNLRTGVELRAGASVQMSVLFALASSVLLLLTFQQMKLVGGLFIIGFFAMLVGDLWILRGLLEKKEN